MTLGRSFEWSSILLLGSALLALFGCHNTPLGIDEYARSPAPLRTAAPNHHGNSGRYEHSLAGGHVFAMYCASCHNARSLAERPFANYRNVAQHMRVRANLTGKEYAELIAWLRRWHDVPSPNPPVEPSPKRFFFSQPIRELREDFNRDRPSPPQPRAEASLGQPVAGPAVLAK